MSDTSSPSVPIPDVAKAEHKPVPVSPLLEKEPVERSAPDPTRYGDWEKNGRCIDF